MLRISVPTSGQAGLIFNDLAKYDIPAPINGFGAENNESVVMLFDDEQEAIAYANDMEIYANAISDNSTAVYAIASDIIAAIRDDEFVRASL